ncbi:MAG TPA: hypothetical protein VG756_09395 [Pseudonocardiaceae bacterium]|nr:hypothetical protein [Pseudonocardiaceae bacterium]
MTANRIEELTEYFGKLGIAYRGTRRHWEKDGGDELYGPYRGATLKVFTERMGQRANAGPVALPDSASYRMYYMQYMRVSIAITPAVKPNIGVIPRKDHALIGKHDQPIVNGHLEWVGKYGVGGDLLHCSYIAADRMLSVGVPEFDAQFGVVCPDEEHARALFSPALAAWFVADARTQATNGTRIAFGDECVHVFFRLAQLPNVLELFTPEIIFPAADYLLDLLAHAPANLVRAAPYQG